MTDDSDGNVRQGSSEGNRAPERLERILDSLTEGVVILDRSGKITYANDAATRLTPFSRSELTELTYDSSEWRITHTDGSPMHPEDLPAARVLETGKPVRDELVVVHHPDRDEGTILSVNAVPYDPAADRPDEVIVSFADVTERERIALELEQSDRRLRQLSENVEAMFWLSSPEGETLYVSSGFEALTGHDATVQNGSEYLRLIHPDDRERMEALFSNPDRAPYEVEYRIIGADGEVKWIRQKAFPIEDEEGEVRRIGGVADDVTESRRAREQLAETARLLQQTVSSIQEAVLVVEKDGETRKIQEVNEAAERIFGYTRSELIGRTPEIFHPNRKSFERFSEMLVEDLEEKGIFRTEFPMSRKDGTIFDAEQTVTLLNPEHGIEGGMVGVIRDVSAQKDAEARLRESEERFRQITEYIDDVFWVTTPEKDVMEYVSPAYEDVWGRPPDELYEDAGRWLEHIHPEDRERVRRALPEQVEGTYEEEYRIVRPDGEIRWIWDRAFPVKDETGNVYRIVGVAEDITERRELEAQLRQSQKMEAVGRLAGGIAHDFNNLLTVIRSEADLILMDLPDGSGLIDEVEIVNVATDRAAELTSQLLAFSREQVLRPKVVDLNEILEKMEQLLVRVLGEDIRIDTELADDLPPIRVDPGQLEQVVLNLAVNARDAMPEGGVLTLTTSEEELTPEDTALVQGLEPGRSVRLTVSDTGVGMDKQTLEKVFEPFFTTKEGSKGTGLGLAVSYGIVKQSGGTIHADSVPDEGSTFTVRFPPAEGERATVEPHTGREGSGAGTTGTILVVEDDPNVRRVTQRILERADFRVRVAEDAEAGLRALEEDEELPDLLLTDLVLSGMGGRELVERVRKRFPEIRPVVMSGYSEGSPGAREDLPDDLTFIQKPFTPDGLLEVIRESLAEG